MAMQLSSRSLLYKTLISSLPSRTLSSCPPTPSHRPLSLLRAALRPLSSAVAATANTSAVSRSSTAYSFSTRATSYSLNDPSPNWSNRPPKEIILLDGCDFEHWLVVLEKPDENMTRDHIIDSYIKTLAKVIGSEEEARMKIYSVSTKHYFAFGALVSEELSNKIKELPGVRDVLADSYLDVKNKDYGGEPFINGQAVPYDPKYHEEWVRNNAKANERNRRNDNRPPKETILLDGCDFEHWLVVLEKPDENMTRDDIIDSYIKTLAKVIGSEEEARMKIYSVSTKHYFAFGALVPEELSKKIKELPGVRYVLPDSYLDEKNKDYGGEPFINGQAVPYDPKYHEEWVRNNAKANERNRRNDNRPARETILLDGCDFEHWLVVLEKPDENMTRDDIIDSYIKTLATVIGSEEEARMKIYSVSTKHYFAFGALVPEELSKKIKELPGVRYVLPDSYLDEKNKDYGGEPFINGQAVPYDPKYHEEWVRNNAKANERNRRNDNRPARETILLDGCDFEHWLVVLEKPDENMTRDDIIDSYIKTLATVIGSEEEARMKIYSVSTKHYFAFGALVPEELSKKIKELPGVRYVLPDSYLDEKNKDYGGEPFINGQAVPYDPKYHEEWVRNNAKANERNRRNDNRPARETILLDGCDFEHWLVVLEKPDVNMTRDDIIDSYIKTLATVIGSEEEARMKIYSVSTKHYFAFGALVSEELSNKIKEFPGVREVLPHAYLDLKNKDYGGEPFINGQAVPYDPKYHEEWV